MEDLEHITQMMEINMARRRYIIDSGSVDNVTTLLNTKSELSASFYATSSCDMIGCVNYDFDVENVGKLPRIHVDACWVSQTCLDTPTWIIEP